MPDLDSLERDDPSKLQGYYVQLGLEPGATMHEIETAYWEFARKLRGQGAMAPYNEAYEALVDSARTHASGARQAPEPSEEPGQQREPAQEQAAPAARPLSKFGWPDN